MPPTAAEEAEKGDRPAAAFRTDEFRSGRPQIVGPDTPESPFPIALAGQVQRGFGRGGKDLGCPTGVFLSVVLTDIISSQPANLPDKSITPISSVAKTGVYYGYAQVIPPEDNTDLRQEDIQVLPMVMSLGWNPFYKNKCLTAVCTPFSEQHYLILPVGRRYTSCTILKRTFMVSR